MGLQQLRSTDKRRPVKNIHMTSYTHCCLFTFASVQNEGKRHHRPPPTRPACMIRYHWSVSSTRLPWETYKENGMKRWRNKTKKATLYVGADIWQHVKTQQTSDLCAACTHPYSQVKMDKMSSFRHSRGEGPPPPPANLQPRVEEAGVNTLRVMPFAISPTTFASQRATAKCQHSINSNNSNGGI